MSALATLAGAVRGLVDLEKATLDQAIRDAAGFAGGDLLDVGCGDKPYESFFTGRVRSHVGVEYEETYQGSLNATLGRADHVYNGRVLPFADAHFGTVLATQILEHVPEPHELFREMARVLAPGGHLILTVPFSFRVHSEPFDFHRFTPYALENLARANGLEVARLVPRGGVWLVIGQKLASHMALRWARLGRTVQQTAGLGYEKPKLERPRWWAIPFVAPLILASSVFARIMDRLDPDPTDTLGYLLVARKRGA